MEMFLRRAADRQPRLGQALVADGGVAVRQQFADFRAVLGDERRDFIEIFHVHMFSPQASVLACGTREVKQ